MAIQSFQALTFKANGRIDKIITDIEVGPAFDPQNPPNPEPAKVQAKALWDTGASKSVLSVDLIRSLGLTPVGTRQVHHGDGQSLRNEYIVNMYLPNQVGVVGVLVTEFPASHNAFSALIGMDVIALGDFAITHVGNKTCMSFRIPSCVQIDYVEEANQAKFAGIGRNDPCRCGSGKKFKKCHGAPS